MNGPRPIACDEKSMKPVGSGTGGSQGFAFKSAAPLTFVETLVADTTDTFRAATGCRLAQITVGVDIQRTPGFPGVMLASRPFEC